MEHYAGIDVALERSSVCVVDAGGRIVREAKVPSEPEALVAFFRRLGIVEWENCMEEDPKLNDEVNCTHIGMAFHPGVYRDLGQRLRQPAS